ncbi:L,D-transpeptidase [Mesorhizobium sp. M1307]|uniref:L,D-transpeptidase n=1 Tax=Mesorhizobium sp. M1307 TaxID=2957079 RepID=UPI0033377451
MSRHRARRPHGGVADLDTSGRNGRSLSEGGEIRRRHGGRARQPARRKGSISMSATRTRSTGIHGTPEPWTIGLDVSSGCIRMRNDDIVDLASRVKVGAKVIVLMQGAALYKGV